MKGRTETLGIMGSIWRGRGGREGGVGLGVDCQESQGPTGSLERLCKNPKVENNTHSSPGTPRYHKWPRCVNMMEAAWLKHWLPNPAKQNLRGQNPSEGDNG